MNTTKQLIKVLGKHTKKNPIHARDLVHIMLIFDRNYTARQLRMDVQFIRTNNVIPKKWIVSGNFGYYITKNEVEIQAWAKRYYSQVKDMILVLNGLKKRYKDYNFKFEFDE